MTAISRWAHTFSICALDPKTGEAGVAVSSACLAVGTLVPFAEPGVGAIATQAFCDPSYGPRGLELLRKGVTAPEMVRRLTEVDVTITPDRPDIVDLYTGETLEEEGVDFLRDKSNGRVFWFTSRIRQLGVVDRFGTAANFDGARLPSVWASHAGKGYCCQGNRLTGRDVIESMAAAFEKSRDRSESMLRCLMAALRAGDAVGGDCRGKRSAALLVVREHGHWSGGDRWCDVRVDDDDQPVTKLNALAAKYE